VRYKLLFSYWNFHTTKPDFKTVIPAEAIFATLNTTIVKNNWTYQQNTDNNKVTKARGY